MNKNELARKQLNKLLEEREKSSGSLSPSQEDKDVTKRLLACSELLGIKMLDHIIVAGDKAQIYSFKTEGELDRFRPPRDVWER